MVKKVYETLKGNGLRHLSKLRKFILYRSFNLFNNITIETIHNCTRNCSYCPISNDKNKGKLMNLDLFYKIVEQLKKMNYRGWIEMENYGESLLDSRIVSLVKYIRDNLNKKVVIYIYTNGDLLTIEKFRELFKAGLSFMVLTKHDGEFPKRYDKFFKELTEEEKEHFSSYDITEESPLFNRGGSVNPKNITHGSRFCRVPMNVLVVRANGIVPICCNDYYNTINQGNVNHQTIMEIWNDKMNKKRREKISKGSIKENVCIKCLGLK